MPAAKENHSKSLRVLVSEQSIDNPGLGNCAFYAFAIGLIDIIQEESLYGCRNMFDRWADLDPSISGLYDNIKACELSTDRVGKTPMLDELQRSLRTISFHIQFTELMVACSDSKGCQARILIIEPGVQFDTTKAMSSDEILVIICNKTYSLGFRNIKGEYEQCIIQDKQLSDILATYQNGQIVTAAHIEKIDRQLKLLNSSATSKQAYVKLLGNNLFQRFSQLYFERVFLERVVDNRLVDRNDAFLKCDSIKIAIQTLTNDLENKAKLEKRDLTFAEEQLALVHLFLKLIYGETVPFESITPKTKPMDDSPIICALKLLKNEFFWGTNRDLDYLANPFEINFHYLIHGQALQPFIDNAALSTITVNNIENWHWTTQITVAKYDSSKLVMKMPLLTNTVVDTLNDDDYHDSTEYNPSVSSEEEDDDDCHDSIEDTLSDSAKLVIQTNQQIIERLKKEYFHGVKIHNLSSQNKILFYQLKNDSLQISEFLKIAAELKLENESLLIILKCIKALQVINLSHPDTIKQEQLNELHIALTNIENAKPYYKQWHQFMSLVKKLVAAIGVILDKDWTCDSTYRGPMRNQFWTESKEINKLTRGSAPTMENGPI